MVQDRGLADFISSRTDTDDLGRDVEAALSQLTKRPAAPEAPAPTERATSAAYSFDSVSDFARAKGLRLELSEVKPSGMFGRTQRGWRLVDFLGGEHTNTFADTDEQNFTFLMDFLERSPGLYYGARNILPAKDTLPETGGWLGILGGVKEHLFGPPKTPVEMFKSWRSTGGAISGVGQDIVFGIAGGLASEVRDRFLIGLNQLSQNQEMKEILAPYVDAAEERQDELGRELTDFASTELGAVILSQPLTRPGARIVPGVKKAIAEAIAAQQGKMADTVVVPLESTQSIIAAAFQTKGHKQALLVARIPGMRAVLRFFSEAAVADDPLKYAPIIKGKLDDMAESAVVAATMKTRLLEYEKSTIGRLIDVMRVKDGIATAPGIRQRRRLPGGKKSLAGHDIVEYAERYRLPENVKRLVTEVRRTSRLLSEMLVAEGVPFKKLKGESDFVYLHRLLLSEKQVALDRFAKDIEKALTAQGSPLERFSGETSFEYLARVSEGVRDGAIRRKREVKALLNQVADTVDVSIRRQSLTKRRRMTLTIDGLRRGNKYADSIGDELEAQARLTYRMVTEKRVGELLKSLSYTKDGLLVELSKGHVILGAQAAAHRARQGKRLLEIMVRGEQTLSPKTLDVISREFPDEVQELLAIRSIRVPELNRVIRDLTAELLTWKTRTSLKSFLNITPARFRQALQQVRGLTPRTRAVSGAEITQTLRILRVSNVKSAQMLRTIYQNSVSIPDRIQKDKLSDLQNKVKAVVKEAKARARMTSAELAMERELAVQSAEVGVVTGVPGVEGRFIPTQEISGRRVLGRDIADEIRKTFGYLGSSGADDAVGIVAEFADYYRLFRASFDSGIQWLQLQGAMGIDASRALLYGKPPTIFPEAAGRSYWAFANPQKARESYWLRPDKYAALVERIQYQSLVQGSEFTSGQTALKQLVRRVPIIGKQLETGVRQTFGRADAAWTTGRDIASNEMWIAFRDTAEKQNSLHELAKMTNLATGVFSIRGIGTSAFKAKFLRAFLFFSPRYTYAQTALFANVLRGGYTGAMARKVVTGIIMANTAITTMAALALDQKPNINPLPKRFGGDGSNLWTVKIGNRHYGIGGLGYSMLRVIVETIGAAWDEPETLKPGTFIRFDPENPLVRAWRGKASGPTSLFWTYVTGRDFIGEPVRDKDSLYPTLESARWFVKNSLLPIWAEELWDSGGAIGPAAAEWFGFRTRPESAWEAHRIIIEEVSGMPYDDIDGLEMARLAAMYEAVRDSLNLVRSESNRMGWNVKEAAYWQARDDIKSTYWGHILKGEAKMEDPDSLHSFEDQKRLIQNRGREAGQSYRDLDKDFADVIRELRKKEPKSERDAAYYVYWDVVFDPTLIDIDGVPLYNERDRRLEEFRAKVGEENWLFVQERLGINEKYGPRTLQFYHDMVERIRPWGEEKERYLEIHPEVVVIEEAIKQADIDGDQRAIDELKDMTAFKKMNSRKDPESLYNQRRLIRKEDPELDAMLRLWGYVEILLTNEAFLLWEDWARMGLEGLPEPLVPLETEEAEAAR